MQKTYADPSGSTPWNLSLLLVGLAAGWVLGRMSPDKRNAAAPEPLSPSFDFGTVSAESTANAADDPNWLSALQDTVNHACDKEREDYWDIAFNQSNRNVSDDLRAIGTKQTAFNRKLKAKALALLAGDIARLNKLGGDLDTESRRMVDETKSLDRLGTFTNILEQMIAIVTEPDRRSRGIFLDLAKQKGEAIGRSGQN